MQKISVKLMSGMKLDKRGNPELSDKLLHALWNGQFSYANNIYNDPIYKTTQGLNHLTT